jgi:hypothetical protein
VALLQQSSVDVAAELLPSSRSIDNSNRSPRIFDFYQTRHHVEAISIRLEVNETVIPSRPTSRFGYCSQQTMLRNCDDSRIRRGHGCRERHQLITDIQ